MRTIFMFSGQGSQYFQMGRALYEGDAVFKASMQRLDAVARPMIGRSVIAALYDDRRARSERLDDTLLSYPATFMVEYSMARCLMERGVQPSTVLGASMGNFAAAVVAGCLDEAQALDLLVEQAKAFATYCGPGGMLAVMADPSMLPSLAQASACELAGINFQSHFSIAAHGAGLEAAERWLREHAVLYQKLPARYAYHSRWIDEARLPFLAAAVDLPARRPRLPLMACIDEAETASVDADFFWSIAREPIRFRQAIERLERQGPYRYVDLGPAGTLATFMKYLLPELSESRYHRTMSPFGKEREALDALVC